MVGRTVGKYRILERIGRGGMGTVYRAVNETLDRHVAIKVLNSDLGEVRSRQPRWRDGVGRDGVGQEVGSRVDLGRMGLLRPELADPRDER